MQQSYGANGRTGQQMDEQESSLTDCWLTGLTLAGWLAAGCLA